MSSRAHSCSVPARAALAGNPSDGHGGAVVATVVASLATTVTAVASDRFAFTGFSDRFDDIHGLSAWIEERRRGDQPLMQASLVVLGNRFGAELAPHRFDVETTIPRSLGLAGSSAIVIATIRSMIAAHRDDPWARELIEQPDVVASLALEAERDVLGIAAGLQDRVVQTLGGTVAMEFGPHHTRTLHGLATGTYRRLGPLPDGMFVAFRAGRSADSGFVHSAVDPRESGFQRAMSRAAQAGRAAADAIDRADIDALGEAMNTTFDQRAGVYVLDPSHVEMIDVARSNGAAANYTGSGGSITVLAPDDRAAEALRRIGCTVVAL